jgi:signal transduction histidine kinase
VGVLVHDAGRVCLDAANERGINICVEVAPGLPRARGDGLRLTQVYVNVISNAVHHAPPNTSVHVNVQTFVQDGRAFVECLVRDDGPGIATDDLKHIFDPFFTRRQGGTGLGLALVQRILEQHGGSVLISNHRDGGAVARIRLPLGGGVT